MGITLESAPLAIGWHNVRDFARHLDEGSAVLRAKHGEVAAFASQVGIAAMLADVCDRLDAIQYGIAIAHPRAVRKPDRPPRPRKRPWATGDEKRIGSGAIPVSEFDEWYYGGDGE